MVGRTSFRTYVQAGCVRLWFEADVPSRFYHNLFAQEVQFATGHCVCHISDPKTS